MHEYSLAAELVDIALTAASETAEGMITAVHVELDPESHIEGSSLADAFALAAAGTRAASAKVEVTQGATGSGGVAITAIDIDS